MGDITLGPNLVLNGTFEEWGAGPSSDPNNWTLAGGGASIAREGTIIKTGNFSAKLTRSGSNCIIFQIVVNAADFKNKVVTAGCWVYATVANRALIRIVDGPTTSDSSFHTGVAGWEFLTIIHTVSGSATTLEMYCAIDNDDTDAYFDDVIFTSEDIPIIVTPGFGFEQALTMVNRQDLRTKEGTLYTYIENGTFRRFNLPWSFVNSSERSLVNSWWQSGQDLRFILDSSFSNSFFTVRIMEVEEPFQVFVKPYGPGDSNSQPLWDGEIVLETT